MKMFAALVLAGGLGLSGAAMGEELRPAAAKLLTLGPVSGVAYYTAEDDGYHVVTTLSSGGAATPVRFMATLQPGQKVGVSVPREAGAEAITVQIARIGDRVHVNHVEKLASLTR